MIRVALDRISFVCLVSLFVVPAWILGGVLRSTQSWLLIVALLGLASAVGHKLMARHDDASTGGLPWLVFAIIAAIALGAIQLVQLEASLHEQLSPQGYQWWTALAEVDDREGLSLSLYPASTRADMSVLTLILAGLVLTCLTVTNSQRRLAICVLAATNGALMAFFGIVQQLSWNGKLFWMVPLTLGGIPFAGFVNRNNAAGYLNMCLGLSLGFFIWSVTRYRLSLNHPLATGLRTGMARPHRRLAEMLASLDTVSILAMTMTVFIAAGVLSTLSRGATVSLIGGMLVTTIVVTFVHRGYLSVISLLAVTIVGLGLTVYLGRAELLQDRFALMFDEEGVMKQNSRLDNWQDASGAVRQFSLTGTGMGTYRFAYEPYEERPATSWYFHAENQYIEALVEGGVGGLLLLLSCIALASWSIYRLLITAADAETNAFGVAAVFVLATQVIHSVFDFGLYMPANAILLAVVCGASASYARGERYWSIGTHTSRRTENWLAVVVVLLVICAGCFGLRELRAAAIVETTGRELRLLPSDEPPRGEILRSHIKRLQQAIQTRPDDAECHMKLANLWIALYRAEAVAEMRNTLPDFISEEELWNLSSPKALHLRARQFVRNEDKTRWNQLRHQHVVCEYLEPAWDHLQKARKACPLIAETHLLMARLSPIFDPQSDGKMYVDRALQMSPGNPRNLFDIGLLEIQTGRNADGIALWRKCLVAAPQFEDEMVLIGTRALGPINFYRQLLSGLPDRILDIVKVRYKGDENRNLRLQLLVLAEQQLAEAETDIPAAKRAYLLATIHALRKEWQLAVEEFNTAVKEEPGRVDWRYEYANALLEARQFKQARFHADLCLRSNPKNSSYRRILAKIDNQQKTRK